MITACLIAQGVFDQELVRRLHRHPAPALLLRSRHMSTIIFQSFQTFLFVLFHFFCNFIFKHKVW